MKNKLLISVLLLFVGMGMKAQSITEEQMDERFNNGSKMPYGWFAEGWTARPRLRLLMILRASVSTRVLWATVTTQPKMVLLT